MGRVIDGGMVPADDPIYNGSWMMFTVRRPSTLTEPEKKPPRKRRTRRKRPPTSTQEPRGTPIIK